MYVCWPSAHSTLQRLTSVSSSGYRSNMRQRDKILVRDTEENHETLSKPYISEYCRYTNLFEICVLDVPGSILGSGAGNDEWGFCDFPQLIQANVEMLP
jgi:hypothetical protein